MDDLFIGAFDPEVATRPGDEAKLGAMVEAALAAPAVEAAPDSTATSGASASRLGWGVAVTGVVVAVVVALAWPSGPPPSEEPVALPTVVEEGPPPSKEAAPAEEARTAVELEPAPRSPAPKPEEEGEEAPVEPSTGGTEAAPTQRSKPAPAVASAADLLRDANESRRQGEFKAADRLFRQLTRKYPGSREERLARVTHGKLLLDKLGRADDALVRFEQYLDDQPRGTLAEEALVGRAKAARKLGRSGVELEAWQQLLDRFPRSAHAPKAQARIDALTQ